MFTEYKLPLLSFFLYCILLCMNEIQHLLCQKVRAINGLDWIQRMNI